MFSCGVVDFEISSPKYKSTFFSFHFLSFLNQPPSPSNSIRVVPVNAAHSGKKNWGQIGR